MKKKIKLGLVTSRGGHLLQLYQLKDWWTKYDRFWITGKGVDSNYLLKKEKVYYGFFPESRNLLNAIRNFFVGIKVLVKEKPDLLISTGAGIAPPVFLAGKLMGSKLIFLDSYSFIKYPSLSARLSSYLIDKTIVQHKSMVNKLKNAEYWGSIL